MPAIDPDRNFRPARALIRLWLEAQDRYEVALDRLTPPDLERPVDPGTLFTEAVRHPAACGYSYLAWIRKCLELPDTRPPHTPPEVNAMESLEEIRAALLAVRADLEATVAPIPASRLEGVSYTSNWGVPFDIDTMLEHAVMHWHRHRLQIENILGNPAPPGDV